jgi:TolA-binding protein
LHLQDYNQNSFRIIERLKVRGKSAPVSVYEIFDAEPPEIRAGKLATKQEFEQGLLLYYMGSLGEAAHRFQECLHVNPSDTVAQIYLQRCHERLI